MKSIPVKNDRNPMAFEISAFEDIYTKTKNEIFFLTQIIASRPEDIYSLYYNIYHKIYFSMPVPKNTKKLNRLLDRIIIEESMNFITEQNPAAFSNKKEDLDGAFDTEAQRIQDIPFEAINQYIKPEFISQIMTIVKQQPDDIRLCLALCCFRGSSLEQVAKDMNISMNCIKYKLYQAHKSIFLWSDRYFRENSYTPFSFLPIVFQRAEQIISKNNIPPDFSTTCTKILNYKKERIENVIDEYHTPDVFKPKPADSDIESAKKGLITLAIIAVCLILIIIFITCIWNIINY